MSKYNKFNSIPYTPYKIALALVENDNLCKLLYYNTYDALNQPNLTYDQKVGMIWNNNDQMQDYHIYLTNTNANIMTNANTLLQCYRYNTKPINTVVATLCYRFDFLFGSKTAMVEYNGYPCNRGDVFEMELMNTLNGEDVAGVGFLQYNRGLSALCGSDVGIGNNETFTGVTVVMATQNGDIEEGVYCDKGY